MIRQDKFCCFASAFFIAVITALAASGAPLESDDSASWQSSKYNKALLDLDPLKAIRLLCPPLNRAVANKDNVLAARIMRMIALAFRLDENDAAAVQAAQLASKLNPDDNFCRFQLADYQLRNGNWQAGEALYGELSKSADSKIALRASALLKQMRGSPEQAIELLEKYNKANPGDMRVVSKLAYLYFSNQDFDESAAMQKELANICHSPYLEQIYLARAEEAKSNYEAALTHYKAAGRINKNDPLWHGQIAMLYVKEQKIKEADAEFRQCFACKRMLSMAYTNWSVMEAFFGSDENARDCIAHALLIRPNSSEFWFARGVIQEKEGKAEQAGEAYEKSIALYPYNSSAYVHLLTLFTLEKRGIDKRIELCRSWAACCPQSATASIEYANTLRKAGKDDEALKSYLHAEEIMKERTANDKSLALRLCIMHANIATIYYKRKEAEAALAEAIIFNKERPESASTAGVTLRPPKMELEGLSKKARTAAEHAFLADVLYECSEFTDAAQEYRLAQKDDPDNITYHSCLLKVLLDNRDYSQAAKEDAAVSHHFLTHVGNLFDPSKAGTATKK